MSTDGILEKCPASSTKALQARPPGDVPSSLSRPLSHTVGDPPMPILFGLFPGTLTREDLWINVLFARGLPDIMHELFLGSASFRKETFDLHTPTSLWPKQEFLCLWPFWCPDWTPYAGVQVRHSASSSLEVSVGLVSVGTDNPFSAISLILCAPTVMAIITASLISSSVAPCCLATARL